MTAALVDQRSKLIEQARTGDRQALERLVAVCRPNLLKFARRHCQSDDVEEAVQDALWILYRKLGGLRSPAAFMGWLFQVVRRACLRYARSRRQHASLDTLAGEDERDASASDPEACAILVDLISRLPLSYREALILRDVQGLTAEEVASELRVPLETAKSRVHRARAMVRQMFDAIRGPSAPQPLKGAA